MLGTFHIGTSDLLGFLMAGYEKRRTYLVRLRVGNSHDTEQLARVGVAYAGAGDGGNGGAIGVTGGSATVENSTFVSNTAGNGGSPRQSKKAGRSALTRSSKSARTTSVSRPINGAVSPPRGPLASPSPAPRPG